jgi:hypothetical protein
MNSLELTQLLTRTAARYRTTLSELELDVYLDDLAGLDDVTLRAALARCAQSNSKYFPTVPEILVAVEELATARGSGEGGAALWEACERRIFRVWSEANDAIVRREGGYPWPNKRCQHIVRETLNLTPRIIALMHAKDYADTRAKFIAAYDSAQAVERAEVAIDAPNVRRLGAGD